jgi:hypothetical protein
MRNKLLALTSCLIIVFGFDTSAAISSAYTGNYGLISGWTYGPSRGLFAYGTATVSSTGVVAYSIYKPYGGKTCSGRGSINSAGVFSFSNGVYGSTTVWGAKTGYGVFIESGGGGYFGLGR